MKNKQDGGVALFGDQKIRRVLIENEWWFSVVDVIQALTDSSKPSVYWTIMKTRVKNDDEIQLFTICKHLKLSAFGLKVDEYKKLKGLERENLRDHMDDIELILTMLGEATTTKLTQTRDSQGFSELKQDASDGGGVAGVTRKGIEKLAGEKITSSNNFLERKRIK